MGRPALTAREKQARGTHRADREKQVSGRVLAEIPKPPFDLNENEMRVWRATCGYLVEEQIVITADLHLLSAYCQNMCLYDLGMADVRKRGQVVVMSNGKQEFEVPNPYFKTAQSALKNATYLAKEMGFTPKSRTVVAPYYESKKQLELFDPADDF